MNNDCDLCGSKGTTTKHEEVTNYLKMKQRFTSCSECGCEYLTAEQLDFNSEQRKNLYTNIGNKDE